MTTGKAEATRSTFRRTVRIETSIRATPERVWALLTDAAGIPSWTSTVTRIDGRIALGERVTITVPYSTRTFLVTVDDLDAPKRLVWSDGNAIFREYRCLADLHVMLKAHGDWMELGSADEQKPVKEGTVEAWGRSPKNPVKGSYGRKKGLRGRFGMYVPPLMEVLGLAEVEHNPRGNRMRAL